MKRFLVLERELERSRDLSVLEAIEKLSAMTNMWAYAFEKGE